MHVVVVGGGFAGLAAAQGLAGQPVQVTVVDRRNHHLFQPLLYQVATAGLAPSDIAEPIRAILSHAPNIAVRLAEVVGIDLESRRIRLDDGVVLPYDRLVLAAGVQHAYFGHPEWEAVAPGLKTVADALDMRRRMLLAFEHAEWCNDEVERAAFMTFVLVGAGPTGVELAGAIQEIALWTLRRDFRRIDPRTARVVLIEAGPSVLPSMDPRLQEAALRQLSRMGIEVRLGARVTEVDARGVTIGGGERVASRTVFWAAGVAASPLGAALGAALDRSGRVLVTGDLSVEGHREVFVAGDLASVEGVPGVAAAAGQMGRLVAANVLADLKGRPRSPFRYLDKGQLATIGRYRAVGQVGPLRLSGPIAWLLWVSVHLWFLVGFRNRLLVFTKWAVAWVSWERSSRLIWGREGGSR